MSDLEHHTQVYVDVYIALRVLGMRYPAYMAMTTPQERALYGYFLALEAEKTRHAEEQSRSMADAESRAREAVQMPYRT